MIRCLVFPPFAIFALALAAAMGWERDGAVAGMGLTEPAPIQCQGCGIFTGYPDLSYSSGLQYTEDEQQATPGNCHCDPTCKQNYGCSYYEQITVTAYGAAGINYFTTETNGGAESPKHPVDDNVFYLDAGGNCDETENWLKLRFYQEEDDWLSSAWLVLKVKCAICAGTCPE